MVFDANRPTGPTRYYIETLEEVKGPFNLPTNVSFRTLFIENKDAQALWILKPGAREPYRMSWHQGLRPQRHENPQRERSKKQEGQFSEKKLRQTLAEGARVSAKPAKG